ncbi:hypothetical protein [Oleiagrimonas sp. C23AA]|uniref:hypothetical protein n=1 Tax=Oleiagrimonas sp. C23AA TaxID=2719047 RepID=UPI00141D7C96|nr:hypothetical protein [Oleiagrimonas sp. C23AA]NII10570.1 hypothetical protein [Oleiagrimonas sp. C23AA]
MPTSLRRARLSAWPGTRRIGLVLALLMAASSANAGDNWRPLPYRLGEGLYFPQQQLRIGGYANAHFYDFDGRRRAGNLNDVSLFVTKSLGNRWKLFSEVEVSNLVTTIGHHTTTRRAEFDVERLYMDYHARRGATVRVGKFLTPFGQWNLVHADPLVWTVSRPLTTTAAFARHATGAEVYGTVSVNRRDLDYWVFADDSEVFVPGQDRDDAFTDFGAESSLRNNFRHAVGAQALYHLLGDSLSIGASMINFELDRPTHGYRLRGVSIDWASRYLELSAETIYRSRGGVDVPSQHGGYLQLVTHVTGSLNLIARYERYRASQPAITSRIRTYAINYQPVQGLVFKLERRNSSHATQLAPSGWLASVAVLF